MDDTTTIRIRDLQKSFGSLEVLKGINLDITRGSVVCLLGPSGSGKSTLLRCINHLETPTAGIIEIAGTYMGYKPKNNVLVPCSPRQLALQRRNTGMVFQHFNLFSHMTVLANVMEGQSRSTQLSKSQSRRNALELLKRVGMADKANAYPSQISGGQQQRVAIARALAPDPAVLLFDEPTSALDPELVGEVLTVIQELAKQGMTMIIVTHEIKFALEVATEVHFMDGGVLVESGSAKAVISDPQEPRTQNFLAYVR